MSTGPFPSGYRSLTGPVQTLFNYQLTCWHSKRTIGSFERELRRNESEETCSVTCAELDEEALLQFANKCFSCPRQWVENSWTKNKRSVLVVGRIIWWILQAVVGLCRKREENGILSLVMFTLNIWKNVHFIRSNLKSNGLHRRNCIFVCSIGRIVSNRAFNLSRWTIFANTKREDVIKVMFDSIRDALNRQNRIQPY